MSMKLESRRRMMFLLSATAFVCAAGVLGAGSASGADELAPVILQIDEAYLATGPPSAPGVIAGAPVADENAMPDGPRAKAGFASVLVYTDPASKSNALHRANVRAFAAKRGGMVRYEYDTVLPGAMNVRDVPETAIEELKKLPGVIRVEKDEYHPNALMLHDSTPLIRGLQSQITAAGLSATGAGVRICVVDTGIDSDHIMYSTRIDTAAGYDFYNDDANPEDDHGHGSHCSGIAAGKTGLSVDWGCGAGSEPFQGVAPQATLIGVKVLNSSGGGYDSDIIAGINYCADQTPTGARADVISMSIGTGSYSGPCTHSWAVAANNAVANGVVAVAASGNNNYANAMSSPACGASVISVGMTWKNNYPTCEDPTTNWNWGICTDIAPTTDRVGCFSNESDYLDVTAPGANIWSASIAAGGSSITGMSGTSMSCPHVAGLAALILGMDPTLTPAEVRQIIRDGALDLGAPGHDRGYGWGRIDVINSLNLVDTSCDVPADCDDGLWCNGAEDCVAGECVNGTAPNCADAVACTTDACNEGTDSCDHTANNAYCDDGLFCNGSETCNVTLGCQAGTDPCAPDPCDEVNNRCTGSGEVWMVFTATTAIPGVGNAENEDIVAYDLAAGTWRMVFDGSDVGLGGFAIDGMAVLTGGNIIFSFTAAGTVGGVAMDDSDMVRFAPTSLGPTTAGSFTMYFDGSDVGLSKDNEDLDAIGVLSDGRLFMSTLGVFSVTGVSGEDEDLLVFAPTSLGSTTAGTFQMYFDGSDVGLSTTTDEDVDAAGFTSSGTILLSTLGAFSVTGVSGADEDIFEFTPTSLGSTTSGTFSMFLDLSALGISTAADVIAVDLIQ
ncbi:MAG: S8 family serine peptidase [Planctomycetota bacterium]